MSNFQFFKEEQKRNETLRDRSGRREIDKIRELLRNLHYFGRYTL